MFDAIRAAQAVLQAEAGRLTAELRAKGFPKCHVEIWINREGKGKCAIVDSAMSPEKHAPLPHILYNADMVAVIANMRAAIAALPDPNAFDAWFVWSPQAEAG